MQQNSECNQSITSIPGPIFLPILPVQSDYRQYRPRNHKAVLDFNSQNLHAVYKFHHNKQNSKYIYDCFDIHISSDYL